jgi:hypothetical protein
MISFISGSSKKLYLSGNPNTSDAQTITFTIEPKLEIFIQIRKYIHHIIQDKGIINTGRV